MNVLICFLSMRSSNIDHDMKLLILSVFHVFPKFEAQRIIDQHPSVWLPLRKYGSLWIISFIVFTGLKLQKYPVEFGVLHLLSQVKVLGNNYNSKHISLPRYLQWSWFWWLSQKTFPRLVRWVVGDWICITCFNNIRWYFQFRIYPPLLAKEYEFIELFAGKGLTTTVLKGAGKPCAALDIEYHEPPAGKQNYMDLLTPAGFA